MDLIRDAQDRVFSSYRASSTSPATRARGAPSSSPETLRSSLSSQGFSSSPLRSRPLPTAASDQSPPRLPPFFQPPSPRNNLESGLDMSEASITPSKPDRNDRSDSGYDSSSLIMAPNLPSTQGDSSVDTYPSSSRTLQPMVTSQEADDINNEATRPQSELESSLEAASRIGMEYSNFELDFSQDTFDFEFDYVNSSFDTSDTIWKP